MDIILPLQCNQYRKSYQVFIVVAHFEYLPQLQGLFGLCLISVIKVVNVSQVQCPIHLYQLFVYNSR